MICDKCGTVIHDSQGCLKCAAQRRSHLAVAREIDRQNSSVTYKRLKSMIVAHATLYGKKIDEKHFAYEGWTQKQCMDFICKRLGRNHKLVKTLEKNL